MRVRPYCPAEAPADCVMLLEAAGDGVAHVNGVPRAGDPYGYGNMRLPVALHAGTNALLFSVGRGRFHGRLLPARQPVMLDTADPTLPDLLTDDRGTFGARSSSRTRPPSRWGICECRRSSGRWTAAK